MAVDQMAIPVTQRRRALHSERLAAGRLRVAIVAETFLPNVNGVTNSVLRLIEHLRQHGHEAIVVAPGPGDDTVDGTPIVRVRSFDLPRYGDVRVGSPIVRLTSTFREFRPDVVHLAAPAVLGAAGVRAARRTGVPTVAVFQTDLVGFAKRHGLGRASDQIWNWIRWLHSQADITLAPSRAAVWALRAHGVPNVELWARGVDLDRFSPAHRSPELRRFLAPHGEIVVGYVGRLAREKQVERLEPLTRLAGVRIVVVGDGPECDSLQRLMPLATFVGFQSGDALSRYHASFDVFVHTGLDETFCQALQESMASGVVSVAPAAGGPLDLVRHGETGYFWSPEVPETLIGAVHELAHCASDRVRMGNAARASVEERPWSTVMDELVLQYRLVALERRPTERDAA